jgi:hypothetical protein
VLNLAELLFYTNHDSQLVLHYKIGKEKKKKFLLFYNILLPHFHESVQTEGDLFLCVEYFDFMVFIFE